MTTGGSRKNMQYQSSVIPRTLCLRRRIRYYSLTPDENSVCTHDVIGEKAFDDSPHMSTY